MRTKTSNSSLLFFALPVMVALAGCVQQPPLDAARASAQAAPVSRDTANVIPPAAPSSEQRPGVVLQEQRGDRLTEGQYRVLVLGNTLSRPLANGVDTQIYTDPDGRQSMRISALNGATATDTGRQTLEGNLACWRWNKAGGGKKMCFEYYWNGRLLTIVSMDGEVQPAQFLIRKGNAAKL
jgi:hypothetical protein